MNKQEKQKILDALEAAYKNTLAEQDVHCERISAMKDVGNGDYLKTLPTMKWKGIAKLMADERYPPCHQDRDKYFGEKFDQYPARIQLDQIEDSDIRASTYFLSEVADHCERIKAYAKFLEVLTAHPEDRYARFLFNFWEKHSIASILADEQKEVGDIDKENAMREEAKSTAKLFDITSKIPKLYQILNNKEEETEVA